MQKITLNIVPNGICPRVYVNQYDIGRGFEITFKDGAQDYQFPGTTEFKINGRKPDNHVFEYTESDKWDSIHYVLNPIVPASNVTEVDVYTTEQMTAAAGEVLAQLTYKINNAVVGTLNFILVVQERPEASGDPSESDLPDVVRSVNNQTPDADGNATVGWNDMSSVTNLAITENTRTMSAQRNAGSFIYVKADDKLYYVYTTIFSGGSLIPGTNASETSVGIELTSLNSDLASICTEKTYNITCTTNQFTSDRWGSGLIFDLLGTEDITNDVALYGTPIAVTSTGRGGIPVPASISYSNNVWKVNTYQFTGYGSYACPTRVIFCKNVVAV